MEKYRFGHATFTIPGCSYYKDKCIMKSGEKRGGPAYLFMFTELGYTYHVRIQKSESGKMWVGVYRRTPPTRARGETESKEQLSHITVNDDGDQVKIEASWLENTYDHHMVLEARK